MLFDSVARPLYNILCSIDLLRFADLDDKSAALCPPLIAFMRVKERLQGVDTTMIMIGAR